RIELRPIRQKVTPNHSGLIKAAARGARPLFGSCALWIALFGSSLSLREGARH
ncbi:hypothetical protein LEMLEM_LOCUS17056, partial [Lemmus lemmus]